MCKKCALQKLYVMRNQISEDMYCSDLKKNAYFIMFTSVIGLDASTLSSTLALLLDLLTVAKQRMAYLADTVFPAPDSPLTMIDWFLLFLLLEKIH